MTREQYTALDLILEHIDSEIENLKHCGYEDMNGEQDADKIIEALECLREHVELGAKVSK